MVQARYELGCMCLTFEVCVHFHVLKGSQLIQPFAKVMVRPLPIIYDYSIYVMIQPQNK